MGKAENGGKIKAKHNNGKTHLGTGRRCSASSRHERVLYRVAAADEEADLVCGGPVERGGEGGDRYLPSDDDSRGEARWWCSSGEWHLGLAVVGLGRPRDEGEQHDEGDGMDDALLAAAIGTEADAWSEMAGI